MWKILVTRFVGWRLHQYTCIAVTLQTVQAHCCITLQVSLNWCVYMLRFRSIGITSFQGACSWMRAGSSTGHFYHQWWRWKKTKDALWKRLNGLVRQVISASVCPTKMVCLPVPPHPNLFAILVIVKTCLFLCGGEKDATIRRCIHKGGIHQWYTTRGWWEYSPRITGLKGIHIPQVVWYTLTGHRP